MDEVTIPLEFYAQLIDAVQFLDMCHQEACPEPECQTGLLIASIRDQHNLMAECLIDIAMLEETEG